jgi:hypothetical protein
MSGSPLIGIGGFMCINTASFSLCYDAEKSKNVAYVIVLSGVGINNRRHLHLNVS